MGVDMTLPETVPAVLEHCETVYQAMVEESSTEEEGLVYEGFLTKLVLENLNLSMPYYTKVTRELKRMGCIHQLRRGGSTTPSRWLLVQEPDRALWDTARATIPKKGDDRVTVLEQRVRDIIERLNAAGI